MPAEESAIEKTIIVPDFAIGVNVLNGKIHIQSIFSLFTTSKEDDEYIKKQDFDKSIIASVKPLHGIINYIYRFFNVGF